MATLYAPYNPTGATRTGKYGIIRPIPLEPDWHNHIWFERYQMDFVNKNIAENNGMISGGLISGDGVDIITPTGGVAYIAGSEVTVATPGTHEVTDDGWTIVYITSAGAFVYGELDNSNVQAAIAPSDAVVVGYAVKGDGVFNVYSFANEILNSDIEKTTQHIQTDITVGPTLTNQRVTDLETTFISSLSAGDKLLFISGVILTAARDISSVGQVELWMDGPAVQLDLSTFNLTLGECSGYISLTGTTGKLILDGLCHGLVINGDITVEKGSNFQGSYSRNGDVIQKNKTTDHTIGTSTQVTNGIAEVYYDSGSTSFKNKSGNVIVFDNGESIHGKGLDALTASIDLSTIDNLKWSMDDGVTFALGIYDLDLGENQRGEFDISGTGGTLTVLSSDGLRIKNSGVTIDVQGGDSIINNVVASSNKVEFESSDLIINVQSSTTVDADAKRLSLLDSNFVPKFIDDLDLTFTMPTDLESGTVEKVSAWYGIWLDSLLNKRLVPDLVGVADSFVSGELRDSAATFLDDLVHDGDIVYNLDDKTKTTASADAVAEGIVVLNDNIFPLGTENYKIVKMSPEGLGENRERIGAAYNNSSSNFDDSTYTQIQELKKYTHDDDFTASTGNASTINRSFLIPEQINDPLTGSTSWVISGKINFTWTVGQTGDTISISGVTFKNVTNYNQFIGVSAEVSSRFYACGTTPNTGDIALAVSSSVSDDMTLSLDRVELNKKPTFHN